MSVQTSICDVSTHSSNLPSLPPEVAIQIFVNAFRSTLVDLTLLSSRKVPEWVAKLDTTPAQGEFLIWRHYWRHVHLYVPGEAWYPIDPRRLEDESTGHFYEQPWHTSMRRMLRFAQHLFCYPEQDPSDPNANPRDFPHPARLRDFDSPPQSVEFEVLCKFDPNLSGRVIFRDMEEKLNIRALLWLFKTLKCHHAQNRHRLNIVLKWKDIRREVLKYPILECAGGPENHYANKNENSKAAIPFGLGIQERYMEVINEGLIIWTTYLLERERLALMTQEQRDDLSAIPPIPKTTMIGTWTARNNILPHDMVTQLAHDICSNLQTKVYDERQVEYVEFWQRVTLNIPPKLVEKSNNGDAIWNITPEFEHYVRGEAHGPDDLAMSEFSDNMRAFVVKHNVKPAGHIYFPHSVAPLCLWNAGDYSDLRNFPANGEEYDSDWDDM